jgi:hypothetical protein
MVEIILNLFFSFKKHLKKDLLLKKKMLFLITLSQLFIELLQSQTYFHGFYNFNQEVSTKIIPYK